MMKIGNVNLSGKVFLAPMAGITDRSFRQICRKFGAALVVTEMISAKGASFGNQHTFKMLEITPQEHPVAVQLFGSEPEILASVASSIKNADIIDINIGCPVPKITKNGEGSALMKNPALVGEIVKAVSSAANVPVTVKIRKGFGGVNNAPEIAKIAEQSGAAAVTVHGRTKEQLYSGQADWEIIKSVKEAVSIPVIGNGDIASPEHAKQMLDMTGCDAVMIGRAAEGNPWIFLQTNHFLETGELLPSPSAKEKIQLALEHFEMSIADKGEHIGMIEMRRHLCAYIKGMAGAVAAKNLINTADSPQKVTEILQSMI